MRVYTAKPRTNGDGYKGLIHEPDADGHTDLINGIKMVRDLHYKVITETGLTTADEMLYPENLPMVDDLVSYHALVHVLLKINNTVLLLLGLMCQLV